MHLKSLSLKGFKSFAETTKISLSPGVTVVVGPNGSGKSNIVDAITWVLGAQGPRVLRSQKMEDVIFAGSSKRSALGRAEVTLVLDNEDSTLEIPSAEVAITRSLNRAGDSEYLVNGSEVRLVDLVELLADAHLGKSQHVIIGQGQIDQMLSSRPEDRRQVIEEAAGIHKHRRRRERAERRLLSSDADVERANDLLREVKRQVKPIQAQAFAFTRAEELKARRGELRAFLAGSTLRRYLGEYEKAEEVKQHIKADIQLLRDELAVLDREVITPEPDVSLGETEVAKRELDALQTRYLVVSTRLRERHSSLSRQLEQMTVPGELQRIEDRIERARAELEKVSSEAEELFSEQERLESIGESLKGFEVDPDEIRRLRGSLLEVSGRVSGLVAQRSGLTRTITDMESQIEVLKKRSMGVDSDLEVARGRLLELTASAEEAFEPEAAIAAIDPDRLVDAIEEIEAKIVQQRKVVSEASSEVASNRASAKALESILGEQRRAARIDEVRKFEGVIGGLFELVGAKDGYEKALEAVLGHLSTSILAETFEAAMEALLHFKRDGSSFSAIISGGPWGNEPGEEDISRYAPGEELTSKLIFSDPRAEQPVRGQLKRVRVVENLSEAIGYLQDFPEFDFVTRSGELIRDFTLFAPGTSVALPLSDLMEARQRLDHWSTELDRASKELELLEAELSVSKQSLAEFNTASKRRRVLQEARSKEVSGLEGEVSNKSFEKQELSRRFSEVESSLVDQRLQLQETVLELEKQEESRSDLEALVSNLEVRQAEFDRKKKALEVLQSEFRLKTAAIQERKRLATAAEAEAVASKDMVSEQLVIQAKEREKIQSELDKVKSQIGLLGEVEGLLSEAVGNLSRLSSQVVGVLNKKAEQLSRISTTKADVGEKLGLLNEELHKKELISTEARTIYAASVERFSRDLEMTEQQILAAPLPAASSSAHIAEQLEELETELAKIGPTNPYAQSELDEANKRITFLEQQLEDVRSSRRELAKVTHQIEREMKAIFISALEDINRSFHNIFSELFPGGEASVVLLDPANVLESGIEFELSIPSKKVKRMSLLSGGERSMVALAFLFAVFQSRPSPFVILDEVEAALDDKNLGRFLGLLDLFRSSSQLLVISHQKRTMEVADVLLGATMDHSGTTKIIREEISQRLPLIKVEA